MLMLLLLLLLLLLQQAAAAAAAALADQQLEFDGQPLRVTGHEPPRVAIRDVVALICRVPAGRAARMKVRGITDTLSRAVSSALVGHTLVHCPRGCNSRPRLVPMACRQTKLRGCLLSTSSRFRRGGVLCRSAGSFRTESSSTSSEGPAAGIGLRQSPGQSCTCLLSCSRPSAREPSMRTASGNGCAPSSACGGPPAR